VSAILLRHLDALEAQLRLSLAQITAARHAIGAPVAAATVKVERCDGVAEGLCVKAGDDDARISRASFGDPAAWRCRGCMKSNEELVPAA